MSCRCNSIAITSLALSVPRISTFSRPLVKELCTHCCSNSSHGEGMRLALRWNHGEGFCLRRPMEKLSGKLNMTLRSQTEAESSINRTVLSLKTEGEDLLLEKRLSQLGLMSTERLQSAGKSWVSNRSPRATSSRDYQHTSGSSHSQTKTWWHHPRHVPPRPLQAQPDLLQSLRDGFGEYNLVKGTRRGGHMS